MPGDSGTRRSLTSEARSCTLLDKAIARPKQFGSYALFLTCFTIFFQHLVCELKNEDSSNQLGKLSGTTPLSLSKELTHTQQSPFPVPALARREHERSER